MLTDALLESANAGVNPKVNPHPNVKAVTVVTNFCFCVNIIIYPPYILSLHLPFSGSIHIKPFNIKMFNRFVTNIP
ncbi:hypothetical protein LamDB_13530 [Bacillus anthracis]|uniref:Uncharacterized protein n=1 Tax=Bacillus anthracis TaxID=1392 RepID=A0A640L9X3_BACAN|nr:hypothetical protein BCM0100_2382 [Bacillus cereus]GAO65191.1 hypothetical protein BA5240_2441 [Bacillus anthracis]BCC76835.1 hypothetical protein BCJMU62_2526 [Bacillus cereus]GET96619.1 hypothetical protein DB1_04950 [Bacillus anthracis]GEU06249.1 hypothetical protein HG1_17340 [Bacillus anthracis]